MRTVHRVFSGSLIALSVLSYSALAGAAETESFLVIKPPASVTVEKDLGFASEWDQKRFSHALLNEVLSTHVKDSSLVDYLGLKKDPKKLNEYVYRVQQTNPDGLENRDEKFAFWINAYNAFTLKVVLEMLPDSSEGRSRMSLVATKPSVWDTTQFKVAGKAYSLNDIEHKILRPIWKDPRVHAAVNCASLSCPRLQPFAYVPEKIEEQLDRAARDWANDPERNRLEGRTMYVSKIFKWYAVDFEGGALPFLAKYVQSPREAEPLKSDEKPEVDYLEYSWALNIAHP